MKTIIAVILVAVGVSGLLIASVPVQEPAVWGATFSSKYMQQFEGVEWKEAYESILNDLAVRHLRIPVYWDQIEIAPSEFVFDDLDYQMDMAASVGADVVMVVGRKVPRWPECHIPPWASGMNQEEQENAAIVFVQEVVNRYANHPALVLWQAENEPFLDFGICGVFSEEYVDRVVASIKEISDAPVMVTDSGELSLWYLAAKRGDVFGTTMYRHVWHEWVGIYTYPIPPHFFRLKRALVELFIPDKPMIVIELQGESWLPKQSYETTPEEQYQSFNPDRFDAMTSYAMQTGFDTFYWWGVEWWYWLKEVHDMPELWQQAHNLFSR